MLSPEERRALRGVARDSIAHGLRTGRALAPEPGAFAPALRLPRASFVTLRQGGALRGCTGSLEAARPLVRDVARSAWLSACGDPRFPPLAAGELPGLTIHISVLGPLEPLAVASESQLLAKLRPGLDGLVLREGERSGTFLPSVWSSLPEPAEFLGELRHKAGLPRDHWSGELAFERYSVEEF